MNVWTLKTQSSDGKESRVTFGGPHAERRARLAFSDAKVNRWNVWAQLLGPEGAQEFWAQRTGEESHP